MPLYIDNILLATNINFHPTEVFNSHPELCERTKTFRRDLEVRDFTENDRALFVHQREIVSISSKLNQQKFTHVCSDDATTCFNVVVIETNSKAFSLAHFDGVDTKNGLKKMFSELREIISSTDKLPSDQLTFDLYLFGGFIDEKKYSENIFIELISSCARSPYTVNLAIACCYSMNDVMKDQHHSPDIYGVAVDVNTNDITIARCLKRGPDELLRDTRMSCSHHFNSVYDFTKHVVYVEPFTFRKMQYTHELLHLEDDVYLSYCSTSPHCEPMGFVERSKAVLLFRVKWEKRIKEIFQSRRREYELDDTNVWVLLDEEQISL